MSERLAPKRPRDEFPASVRKVSQGYRLKEYRAWINMKSRCYTPSSTGFENYGGRGITVCDRWRDSFDAFYADMGPRPTAKHSIDRRDVNGSYEPGNCRWATMVQQARNTRKNRKVGDGVLVEAIQKSGLKTSTVASRLRRGWPIEAALTLSLRKGIKYAP